MKLKDIDKHYITYASSGVAEAPVLLIELILRTTRRYAPNKVPQLSRSYVFIPRYYKCEPTGVERYHTARRRREDYSSIDSGKHDVLVL